MAWVLSARSTAAMHDPPDEPRVTARDRLALRRTELANERTLLAYLRTALMLVASGATLLKFASFTESDRWIGWGAIAAGMVVAGVGAARFARVRRALRED